MPSWTAQSSKAAGYLAAIETPMPSTLRHKCWILCGGELLNGLCIVRDVSAAFSQGESRCQQVIRRRWSPSWRADLARTYQGWFRIAQRHDRGRLEAVSLVPGLLRAFHPPGSLRALASTHVGDARYAGNETSQVLRDAFHAKLKFGKLRRAIEGWQKFCGR